MHETHFENLMALMDIEREAERSENERKLEKLPVQAREALGKTVTRLVLVREDFGVGGHPLWILNRPSAGEEFSPFQALNQGDLISLSFQDPDIPRVRGTLYDVDQYEITVALDGLPALDGPPKGKWQLDVLGSEATYKRMKKALGAVMKTEKKDVSRLREIFMGDVAPEQLESEDSRQELSFFNERLNKYQQEAVRKALAARDVALVHGPPGTGKTTVLVEIIRQAVAGGARVLASAPSNIAVDNMLEKLLDAGLNAVRMGHPARILDSLRHATVSARVAEHLDQRLIQELDDQRERLIKQMQRAPGSEWHERSQLKKEINALWQEGRDLEYAIGKQILAGADVVLVTHGGIAKPILKKPFDLLIMDEASQATEPLSWVPITQAKKVVFAGDSLQLPPTIYSIEAKNRGLGVTLFERLQALLPKEFQTLLRIQYRMHETIMGFSSQQFYEGALQADETVRAHRIEELPGVAAGPLTGKPLMYVDTAGAGYEETWNDLLESRENEGEAKLALYFYRELRDAGVPARSIALLTPYVAQARLLKGLAADREVEIGSIDGFQGREKEAIILSLVRSNHSGEVGFLGDTRRMNVGMTRARRLLIVLGDSATLSRHPFYLKFIEYVDRHEAHHSAWEWIGHQA